MSSEIPFGIHLENNLDLLRRMPDDCVDLAYCDPPFNTGKVQSMNRIKLGTGEGTRGGFLGKSYAYEVTSRHSYRDDMPLEEYLDYLGERLVEIRRVLKPTGSLYLHLDWNVVHYARFMLDDLFGPENFLNEIIWSYDYGGRARGGTAHAQKRLSGETPLCWRCSGVVSATSTTALNIKCARSVPERRARLARRVCRGPCSRTTLAGGQARAPAPGVGSQSGGGAVRPLRAAGRGGRDPLARVEQPRQVAVGHGESQTGRAGDLEAVNVSKVLLRSTSRSSRAGLLAGPSSRLASAALSARTSPMSGLLAERE